ncbi:three-helix bundle dimerization domain-containing protein [Mycolicibacterium gilvum]|uniref:three-helix bundle dimerization domain-containing protein n=1 Tax=Mycolicibacterium gilvum TaxID=1804 RepID=UPI0040452612
MGDDSGAKLIDDELRDVIATLRARYPECPTGEIEALVADIYGRLNASATVSAHLIPLTMNLSLRALRTMSQRRG